MNYPESVDFLYALGNEYKSFKLGLEAIEKLVSALQSPHKAFRVVHAAGTNGKGSICAMIESGLRAAGVRTGLYTSPHLIEPAERIQIEGKPVSREEFARAFAIVHDAAGKLVQDGSLPAHPTYFETVTAMAFVLFRDRGVETAVVETGLGGRLDATNVVDPALTVITPIDYDHERWLGSSITAIAGEKAGILKPGVPVVLAEQQHSEAATVVRARAAELGCPVFDVRDVALWDIEVEAEASRFVATRRYGLQVVCPLPGEHQVRNAATAIAALEELETPPEAIVNGIARTSWPGRLETVSAKPHIILDGAHNPAGARVLASHVKRFYGRKRRWIVYGAMRDKSVDEITEILFPEFNHLILTAPDNPRAARPETLASHWDHMKPVLTGSTSEAIAEVRKLAAPEDVVFITGSLFVVGEARGLLVK